MKRQRQRGTAILITMIVTVALLGGGAVLVGMQMSSTKSTEVSRSSMTALYCAEAGLNAARKPTAAAYTTDGTWGGTLGSGSQPAFLNDPLIDHDLDGDGVDDFTILLEDNQDELTFADTPGIDNDLQIYIVSTCTKFAENKKQIRELIRFKITKADYGGKKGGANTNNNENPNN